MGKGLPGSAKSTALMRVESKTKEDIKQLARELSVAQKMDVPAVEALRRTVNWGLMNKDYLMKDAEAKRQRK